MTTRGIAMPALARHASTRSGSGQLGVAYTGAYALLQAEALGLPKPRVLIAPGWTDQAAIACQLAPGLSRMAADGVRLGRGR